VPASQTLLFPDPRPLVERLGHDFFRQLTEHPGVYLMQDAAGLVLYVGKAKNLRKRLGSYRVANPDRLGRRHLRLLSQVARIELQECADESAALTKEAELLLALKPKFNRAGVWPATPRFLVWRFDHQTLELAITETPATSWQAFGPFAPPYRKASRAANVQRLSSRKKDVGNQVVITITNFTCIVQSARLHATLKKRSGLWNSHRRYFNDFLEEAISFRGHQDGHQKA
jgi:predicted GIY-YIG superfamily endonuclease